MAQDLVNNDLHVNGSLSAKSWTVPANVIGNTQVKTGDPIDTTKLEHRHCHDYEQASDTEVVAESRMIHSVRGVTGNVVSIRCAIETVATGADRTITVDLHKSTGAGAFATILTATIGYTNGSAERTVTNGTIATPALVVGDILKLVVTDAGAAGAQAQGLVITVEIDEDAS